MVDILTYIKEIGEIVEELDNLGRQPILIGGIALAILGSQRITKDFDFVVSTEAEQSDDNKKLLEIFYKRDFELVSKINSQKQITATIDNKNIAAMRLKLDEPDSIYFYNKKIGLRIDLLFDFPFPAHELAARAEVKKIKSYTFRIASKADLLALKKIAYKNRKLSTDLQDLEFLKKLK